MLKKILLITFCFLPGAVMAQDASSLGPQGSTSGSSPQTLNMLQPASPSSLQASGSNNGGIGQPSQEQALQQTQDGATVKVLMDGDGTGSGQLPLDEQQGPPYWFLIFPLILAVVLWARKQHYIK